MVTRLYACRRRSVKRANQRDQRVVPRCLSRLWSVVTNKTPVGTLRSPGRPECNFARERLMDLGAARLGLDPAEIRRRNLIRPAEMPYDCGTTSFGASTVYDSGDYPALFDDLVRRLGYDRARADRAVRNAGPGRRRGIGLAVYVEKTGLGPFETAHVEARPDGRFTVDTGASSMGPGLETVLAQILGEALGLGVDRFDVRHADTAQVESGSTRSTRRCRRRPTRSACAGSASAATRGSAPPSPMPCRTRSATAGSASRRFRSRPLTCGRRYAARGGERARAGTARAGSEHRDRVDGRAGDVLEAERRDGQQELPAPALGAGPRRVPRGCRCR